MSPTRASRQRRLAGLVAAMLLLFTSPGLAVPSPPQAAWLILYDSRGAFGWIGELHAKMLANLLGHFPLTFTTLPVEDYRRGDLDDAAGLFYLGTLFDNPLPTPFLDDVIGSSKPVCWFKYNLWQLAWSPVYTNQFADRFGFRFEFMDASGFALVRYQGETFSKNLLDPDMGRTTVVNPVIARVHAVTESPDSTAIPYVVHASNFWYVADSPFSFIDEEDRYIVFADLLHDIVQVTHPPSRRAIIRLEDVNATYPINMLRQAADLLAEENVPFAVAVIPVYVDALGHHTGGVPRRLALSDSPQFVDVLRYLVSKRGQLLLHGYTHQYDTTRNPVSGVTADDYEFFRVVFDENTNVVTYAPVPEDSAEWARARVTNALHELQSAELAAVGWETPHYAASPVDYAVFASMFSLTVQRVLYFSANGRSAGQFFPYVIQRDVYGQKVIPENLGNVEPNRRSAADIVRAARKNRVVRDGWANAFFHPYLSLDELREIVRGVKALGYVYVPVAAPLAIGNFAVSRETISFSFLSETGNVYHIERAPAPEGSWTVAQSFIGTGATIDVRDSAPTGGGRFYRIRVEAMDHHH